MFARSTPLLLCWWWFWFLSTFLSGTVSTFQPTYEWTGLGALGRRKRSILDYRTSEGTRDDSALTPSNKNKSNDEKKDRTIIKKNKKHVLENTGLSYPFDPQAFALSTRNEMWSQEWHDSFVRNDLVDFVPPLTSTLDCLLVGDNVVPIPNGLPDTSCGQLGLYEILSSSILKQVTETGANEYDSDSFLQRLETSPVAPIIPEIKSSVLGIPRIEYDCILDIGLMNHLILRHNEPEKSTTTDLGILLLEAARQIREHGVYVVTTQAGVMSPATKAYLRKTGRCLGMDWKFDLDGISNDHVSVSVARRYFTGQLPSVGSLAHDSRFSP